MHRVRGFTLIELMIAVAIVAILASIAVPSYTDYVRRGKLSEAIANLSDMQAKMEQYFQDNRTYAGACVAGTLAPPPTGRYFTYACSDLAATTYTVTATGAAGSGVTEFRYSINQANVRTTLGLPAGWAGVGNACWVVKKDGSC